MAVVWTAGRERLREVLRGLPAQLAGKAPDPTGAVAGLLGALGLQPLRLIRDAYVVKARGGTDAAGIKWPALKRTTVAYGRRHPGKPKKRRPTLTAEQDRRWRTICGVTARRLVADGVEVKEARARAGAAAWTVLKAEGAVTVLEKYGDAPVEILRDTGLMLATLSPGSGQPEQLFRVGPGAVAVGSNLKRAEAHHRGNPARGLPRRPLWPDEGAPEPWLQRLRETLADGVRAVLSKLLGG